MKDLLNGNFFGFLTGFFFILSVSLLVAVVAGHFDSQLAQAKSAGLALLAWFLK